MPYHIKSLPHSLMMAAPLCHFPSSLFFGVAPLTIARAEAYVAISAAKRIMWYGPRSSDAADDISAA